MGYAGGTTAEPNYYAIADHAECLEMDFDPSQIRYQELLTKFWEWHNPFRKPYARQYMSAVFYHSEEQRQAIEVAIARFASEGRIVHTEVAPYQGMTRAEDYHQKYHLRRNQEAAFELKALFPRVGDFIDSFEVMRVNSMLGGSLIAEAEELEAIGLSAKVRTALLRPTRSLWQRITG